MKNSLRQDGGSNGSACQNEGLNMHHSDRPGTIPTGRSISVAALVYARSDGVGVGMPVSLLPHEPSPWDVLEAGLELRQEVGPSAG